MEEGKVGEDGTTEGVTYPDDGSWQAEVVDHVQEITGVVVPAGYGQLSLEVWDEIENRESSRSLPSLSALRTPLWPCQATSAIHMLRILKPWLRDWTSRSSHKGSYSSYEFISTVSVYEIWKS